MTLLGGEAVCYGYHVWSEARPDECLRCGFVDYDPRPRPRTDPRSSERESSG